MEMIIILKKINPRMIGLNIICAHPTGTSNLLPQKLYYP